MEKVSVIIPTFGRPKSLGRAIESVLKQSYMNIETIVVDDNNPTSKARMETEMLLCNYKKNGIKYLKHNRNLNGSAARNTGIKNATGELITFLDDDDAFFENKIKDQVDAMQDCNYEATYCDFVRVSKSNVIEKSCEKRSGNLIIDLLARNLMINAGSNVMFRKKTLLELRGFDESFQRSQDLEILVRFFDRGNKLKHVNKVGLSVYMDERATSKTNVGNLRKVKSDVDFFNKKFTYILEKINNSERDYIRNLQNLELLKIAIINKNIVATIKIMKKIKFGLVCKYIKYLIDRKKNRAIYSFHNY
ncbi:glycosyltransferase family 2 protein [Lactiplantibacillus argentoratensis]|uniref:glycosyltransferase family 2 protein n=1 Tax=Lactiplantibacillus argentoratensis TaxID=271881 RepID=UPI003F53E09C